MALSFPTSMGIRMLSRPQVFLIDKKAVLSAPLPAKRNFYNLVVHGKRFLRIVPLLLPMFLCWVENSVVHLAVHLLAKGMPLAQARGLASPLATILCHV